MMKKKTILTLTSYIFLLHIVNVHAVETDFNPYVFRIKADTCSDQKGQNDIKCSTRLTGFISKEMNGIITALHGVVKRKHIHAIDYDNEGFSGLKIEKVDFDYDIALITSHELESKIREKDGLNFLRRAYSKKDYEGRLYTTGYPINMMEQLRSDKLSARIPFLRKLKGLLPEGTHTPMETRKSPNIDFEVISLEGHLLPGHSGAPILNKNNEVIGIANGGLKDGAAGICWAVPYNKIHLVSKSLKKQELASLPIKESALFSFTSVLQISKSKTLILQQLRSGEAMNWYETQNYTERMNREAFEGYSDWRVPARVELRKIAQSITSPDIDTDNFYWSSEGKVSQAWAVHLGSGDEKTRSKRQDKLSVWLVRNF